MKLTKDLDCYLWQNITVLGDYIGYDWSDHLQLGVYNYQSSLAAYCNHLSLLQYLKDNEIIHIETSFNHFACGHYYAIMIPCNELTEDKQDIILKFLSVISNYPIWDDQKYSELEQELISENWDKFSAKEILEDCLKNCNVELLEDCIIEDISEDNLWELYQLYCNDCNVYPYAETCEIVYYDFKQAKDWFSFDKLLQSYPDSKETLLQGYLDNYGYAIALQ